MLNRTLLALLCASALGLGAGACQSGDDTTVPATGGLPNMPVAATGGGDGDATGGPPGDVTAGVDSMQVPEAEWGMINADCVEHEPYAGMGAPRGTCCYRGAPNSARLALQPADGLRVKEYRLNHMRTTNHPYSIGMMALLALNESRNDYHEWNMLWRFEQPYANGQPVAGDGWVTIGWGVYNCDGTHSHYGDAAAPTDKMIFPGGTDAGRWKRQRRRVRYNAPGTEPAMEIGWDDRYMENTFTPFINAETFALEWELIAQNFTIESMDLADTGADCTGSWSMANGWTPNHYFMSYAVIQDNHYTENGIPGVLQFQTLSQLLAFGILAQPEDRMNLNPKADGTPRCQITQADLDNPMPRTRMCRWVKLPSALCPITPEERALYNCHVGTPDNTDGPNGTPMAANCTQTAPTTPRDDTATDEGQCCDPLGNPASGLPACNAYPIRNEFVAAAAEITDAPYNGLPMRCPNPGN